MRAMGVALVLAVACGGEDPFDADLMPFTVGFGGTGTDATRAVAATGDGLVIAGLFSGMVMFGDQILETADAYDGFVSRLDAAGGVRWTIALGATGNDVAEAVAVGPDGSIAVAGSFTEKVALGDQVITSRGQLDAFVACLDPDGEVRWVVGLGGGGNDGATGVAFTADGDVLVAGSFTGTAGIGDTPLLQSAGDADAFALRLDPDGAPRWAAAFGGRGMDAATDVAALPGGGAALSGTFEANIHFGGQEIASKGLFDGFVARLDGDGVAMWSATFGGTEDDFANAVAADANGAVAVAGTLQGDLDGDTTDGFDAFAIVYDTTGGKRWQALLSGPGRAAAHGVAFTPDGGVLVSASFNGAMSDLSSAAESNDVAVARYEVDGAVAWLQRFGGDSDDGATAIAAAADGTPAVAGYFTAEGNFAHAMLASAGLRDGFVLTLPSRR